MIPPDPGSPRPADPAGEPVDPEGDAIDPAGGHPDHVVPTPAGGPSRPGAGTFTIEGRSAPGLFVVGWLATITGLVAILVAFLAGGSSAAPILATAGFLVLSVGLIAGAGSQGIERRARGEGPYVGPSPFLVFTASVPVSLLAIIVIAIPLTVAGVAVDGPVGRLASVLLQALVYVGLIRLLVVDTGALSWAEMGVSRFDRRAFVELSTGALGAFPVILATVAVAIVLYQLIPVTPASPLPPAGEPVGFALNLLAGAIIAPIGEEVMFRAFATTAWAQSIGARRALIRGALFFAFVHVLTISGASASEAFGLVIVGFAARIPVALALGWLFLERRSVWAPIGLHATFNAVLLIVAEIAARSGLVPS